MQQYITSRYYEKDSPIKIGDVIRGRNCATQEEITIKVESMTLLVSQLRYYGKALNEVGNPLSSSLVGLWQSEVRLINDKPFPNNHE